MHKLKKLVEGPNPEALKLSLMDCHIPGLMSLVLDGEPGHLTRVFLARERIAAGQVALHSHKYHLNITALTPGVWHQRAISGPHSGTTQVSIDRFVFNSAITGDGQLTFKERRFLSLVTDPLPINSTICLSAEEVHTMWCDAGSVWCVEECGYSQSTSTNVYGKFFSTEGLYNKPTEEDVQEALNELRTILA